MTNNSDVLMPEDGAHASLQTTEGYDFARVKRELDEDHAKMWDLVRLCYAAEESDLPVIDVHRLVADVGDRCLVALAMDIVEEGWLEHNPTKLNGDTPLAAALAALPATAGSLVGRAVARLRCRHLEAALLTAFSTTRHALVLPVSARRRPAR